MAKPSKPKAAPDPTRSRGWLLNEDARLHPWKMFNQGELEEMTELPRLAVQAAFETADFPAQFGRSRPEDLFAWVRAQDAKIQAKEAKDLPKGG